MNGRHESTNLEDLSDCNECRGNEREVKRLESILRQAQADTIRRFAGGLRGGFEQMTKPKDMSLRDWFAGQALGNSALFVDSSSTKTVAKIAYLFHQRMGAQHVTAIGIGLALVFDWLRGKTEAGR